MSWMLLCIFISLILIRRSHRDSLWIIMRKFGIPNKLIQMVKALYEDFKCSLIEDDKTNAPFPVMTGVKQDCCMPGFMFPLIIDWLMQQTVKGKRTGIRRLFIIILKTSTLRTTLLCCHLIWTISSTRQKRWKTTQLRSVWSWMLRKAKFLRSTVRVKLVWIPETVKLRRCTASRTWAPMSPRKA